MPNAYERYRNIDYRLPDTYLSWDLFGAGLENLGRDGKPIELPLRPPEPDQVLLRVDALGLCFSDAKLIWAGANHPRIRGRDLAANPTVAGHEAALTVVAVGSNWQGKYAVGQRFTIQVDITIDGVVLTLGYVQRGCMAQYLYVDSKVLDANGVCYLLPLRDTTGYVEAALVEPWACVEAAYHIPERVAPLAGEKALIVMADPGERVDFTGLYPTPPRILSILGGEGVLPGLNFPAIHHADATPGTVSRLADEVGGFDDIFFIGRSEPDLIDACDAALARSGVLCFLSCAEHAGKFAVDIGRVHYDLTRYAGSGSAKVRDAYGRNVRTEIRGGGKTWMVGGAGPMGQMHVQRALELAEPPRTLLCTDVSEERLRYMETRLRPLAERKGVEFVCLNPAAGPDGASRIRIAAENGFDDVYVHAPVAALVEDAAGYLGDRAVFNVFAGVAIGTRSRISPEIFRTLHARLIGSSGSSLDDMVNTLRKLESGQLATRMSMAALGGIEDAWLGMKGVKENRFPGKTVIFPHMRNLGLMAVDQLAGVCPEAAAKLENGSIWTNEAEAALIEARVCI